MVIKTPKQPEYELSEFIEDFEQNEKQSSKNLLKIATLIALIFLLVLSAFLFFSSSEGEQSAQPNQLLGPTDVVESYGWESLDSVCLNNRIIGAAPLKGICGPTWEKIFTQISQIVTEPGEIVTVTETETIRVFEPGNRVYLGPRNPRVQEGISGDVFINQTNGDLFTKTNTAWNLSANVAFERVVTEIQTVTRTETIVVGGGTIQGSGDVGSCQGDEPVSISVQPTFVSGGWKINTVTFSDLEDDCVGKTLDVQLLDSNNDELSTADLIISGTSEIFNFSSFNIPADSIYRLVFAIYDN